MELSKLVGQTVVEIDRGEESWVGDYLMFITSTGKKYKMYHEQNCCESVVIDDIVGDLNDLIGSPILKAEETINSDAPRDPEDEFRESSFTWTFYHFATIKGYVTIRWYGSSNGYYSEEVSFVDWRDEE